MMNKVYQHMGLFSYGIYFIFACIFFQERTLFLDNPFQIFLMIVEGDIAVNAHRWPAVIVRFIPYLLIQLEVPIKFVLLSFSLSYWLFHFCVFYIIRYKLRERSFALLQLTTVTLPVVHSFFWCNSEQNLAVSLLVLTLALFSQKKYIWTSILCFVLLWLHPLIFLPFGFAMSLNAADLFINKRSNRDYKAPIYFALGFTTIYVLKSVFIKNWYDKIKAVTFKQNLSTYDFNIIEIVKPFLFDNYFLFPVLTAVAICILIIKRLYVKAGLWMLFVVFYLTILDISGSTDTSYMFYDEVNYLLLFFGAALLLKDHFQKLNSKFKSGLFICACILTVVNWCFTSSFYSERIAWYKSIGGEYDRSIVDFQDVNQDMIIMPWASAYESLVISCLSGDSSTTLITNNVKKYSLESSLHVFYTEFKSYDLERVNNSYFELEDKSYVLNPYINLD